MDVLQDIIQGIDSYLDKHSSTKEIELIQYLKSLDQEPFSAFNISHSKDLFRAHFLLKHALYHLQNIYYQNRQYILDISLINISRQAFYEGTDALITHDTVKEYYLDISHYFETEEEDVNRLLDGFWKRFFAGSDRHRALEVLGLGTDADYGCVKLRYRELAQIHHPDKGGCEERFKEISGAKKLLDTFYRTRS